MKRFMRSISIFTIMILLVTMIAGCGKATEEEEDDNVLSGNIILTETGETLILPQEDTKDSPHATLPSGEEEIVHMREDSENQMTLPNVDIDIPYQEQGVIMEEQTEESDGDLQIVFLGDSIFDNNRDGTGVPYLTVVQCDADIYNLAIGGTSATIEEGESTESNHWTSRSLLGVVKAMKGEISTDIFEGSRTKEILDDPEADFSKTDYFVVEYGINDYFRAVPLDDEEEYYNLNTYAGALRYAITNLKEIAPDATIIMCGPHYCQFFSGNQYVGDGNILNTGHGTLFDYKGICQYVAWEQQVEFYDAYVELGINGYTAEEYLEDGVHLSEAGRELYADALATKILNLEETRNN